MQAMLLQHISDENSSLAKLFANKREFDSEVELKAHLQECLANMWDSLEESMHTI